MCSFRLNLPTLPKATPWLCTSLSAVQFVLSHGCVHGRPVWAIDDTLPISLGNPITATCLRTDPSVFISSLSRSNFQGDLS